MDFIISNINEIAQWAVLLGLAGGIKAAWSKAKSGVTGAASDIRERL